MCVPSRFDPLSGNLQQTSYRQWKKKPGFALSPARFPHFLGVRRAVCLRSLRVVCVAAQREFNPVAEGTAQLQGADAGRADFFPLVYWVGLCTSSLLRMGALGEEKSLQSLWYCFLSALPLSLQESIWILAVISIIIGFMLSNQKIIYQTHMWN